MGIGPVPAINPVPPPSPKSGAQARAAFDVTSASRSGDQPYEEEGYTASSKSEDEQEEQPEEQSPELILPPDPDGEPPATINFFA
jgi:hypothetical protein